MKKLLSLTLAMIMSLSVFSFLAFAEDDNATITFENPNAYEAKPYNGVSLDFESKDCGFYIYSSTGAFSISAEQAYKGKRSLKFSDVEMSSGVFFGFWSKNEATPVGCTLKWHFYVPSTSQINSDMIWWADNQGWTTGPAGFDTEKKDAWQEIKYTLPSNYAIVDSATGFQLNMSDITYGTVFYVDSIEIVDRNGKMLSTFDPGVQEEEGAVIGMTVDKTSAILEIGATDTLTASVIPADATNKNFTWTIDKPEIATIDENGKITAVAAGNATAIATSEDGNYTATCLITVKEPDILSEKIELDQTSLSLKKDETAKLKFTITPSDVTTRKVTWKSSDEKIATVSSSGKVTAVSAGTATITVTTQDNNKSATCAVTVASPFNMLIVYIGVPALLVIIALIVLFTVILPKRKNKKA